jgi:ribosomal protein S18 acetylase RimI-like enzyme
MALRRRKRRIRERALRFQRTFEDGLAVRTEPFEGGTAIFRPEMPRVFDFNYLRVESPPPGGAEELAEEAERLQGAAGLLHRKIVIEDEGAGQALLRDFRKLGWLPDHLLLMALDAPPPGPAEPPVEIVEPPELIPAQELNILNDPHDRSPEVVRQLLAAEEARAASLPTRGVAVRSDGEVASWCLLYTDDGVAEIDQVTTLPEHRRRGYGDAVMRAAVGRAGASGSELVFLWADDRDWPKDWYARLGFEPVARRYAFLRRPR